jgi:hypothetical protein
LNENLDLKKLSISLWVKSSDFNRYGYLFEKTTNSYVNTQYSLFISKVNNESCLVWRTNPLSDNTIAISDWSKEDLVLPIKDNFKKDNWHHIVVTYDGKNKRIYINGILKASMEYNKRLRENKDGISIIGAHGRPFNMFFKGGIRDLRIYKKALDLKEIKELYSRG